MTNHLNKEAEKLFEQWRSSLLKVDAKNVKDIFTICARATTDIIVCYIEAFCHDRDRFPIEKKLECLDAIFEDTKNYLKHIDALKY
jgi:hypothetical protein